MSSKGKRLYSMRYPPFEPDLERFAAEIPPQTAGELDAGFADVMRQLNDERCYVPNPDKEEKGRRFVALARELSEAYKVDMDIWEEAHFVRVELYLLFVWYPDDFTHMLGHLLGMCDRMYAGEHQKELGGFALSLDLSTCDYRP